MPSLDRLIERLGVRFADPRLLQSALVHPSLLHERPDQALGLISSERLEFLGDAILNYLAATLVFERFPDHRRTFAVEVLVGGTRRGLGQGPSKQAAAQAAAQAALVRLDGQAHPQADPEERPASKRDEQREIGD